LCDAPAGKQTVCVRKCESGCKSGEICTEQTPNRYSCQPDPEGLCRPCSFDVDCPFSADKCLSVDGIGVCGRDCSFDGTCPTSYQCTSGVGLDGRPKAKQCVPASGSCTCTASSAGQHIACEVTNGFGTCHGTRTCDGVSGYGACTARTPASEICNGIDDDCNGIVDDGQPSTSCGVGACLKTVSSCGDAGVVACVPGPPMTELCNGLDDDCDGVVDNGFNLETDVNHCGSCSKACALANAQPKCAAHTCEVASCNAGFGDCDGVPSNGCEANFGTDPNNCTACNHACSAPNSDPGCGPSGCTFTCKAGYVDLDKNPANGCEYKCTVTSTTDLPDVGFVDANCDGMDGEINNGIFVSSDPGSSDSNPGTVDSPMKTIAAGIAAAVTKGKRDVYVSSGNFTGPLSISGISGINVAGGYTPGAKYWAVRSVANTIITGGNPALSMTSANVLVQNVSFIGDSAVGLDGNGHGKSAYAAQIFTSGAKLELVKLIAGNGVSGTNGVGGTTGLPGGNGGDGAVGCTNDNTGFPLYCSDACARPAASTAGTSSCNRAGGTGGRPGYSTPANGAVNTGDLGVAGLLSTQPGAGGSGFSGGSHTVPQPSQQGTNGANGGPGSNGAAPASRGLFSSSGYFPAVGANGLDGQPGEGGGGGGGGGGGCVDLVSVCHCFTYGSVGGGGGGGGCNGTGGTAGHSGGASIALMLYGSQLQVKLLTLQSGTGGNGGAGGSGAGGALGGSGGTSSVGANQGYSGVGGSGGKGGAGGPGGAGAGGAGGPSWGVLRDPPSTINTAEISFVAGVGGLPGPSAGNQGPAGPVSVDVMF
jgi:hypothetical protein